MSPNGKSRRPRQLLLVATFLSRSTFSEILRNSDFFFLIKAFRVDRLLLEIVSFDAGLFDKIASCLSPEMMDIFGNLTFLSPR